MKKILTIAVLGATLAGFTACDSFLDEEPRSEMTSVAFNQTAAQMIGQVNYLYRNGVPDKIGNNTGAYRISSASVTCMPLGYFTSEYEGQESDYQYARLLTRQSHTQSTCTYQTDDVWETCYRAINIANSVLKYIDGIDMTNQAQYKAEAQFFRAWNYFYLVKMFGDVPLHTEPTEGEVTYPERTSAETIYTSVIIPDLTAAVENLPASTFAGNSHRVTKAAAQMVLANVYMMRGDYANAATQLRDIISSGLFSLTTNDDLALNSAYNKLRENDDLPEVIYAYEYDGAISNTGNLPTHAFNQASGPLFDTYSLWVNVYGVSNRFMNIYDEDDLRAQPNQFFHWSYTNPNTGQSITFESPCNWYWYDETAVLETAQGTKDWNFFRYAETLLSAAECIAQTEGVTAEAAGYLAQVKARANMEGEDAGTIAATLQGMGQQAFIEECWKERLREFPLEFKAWDDCVRTMKFPNISTTTPGEITFVDLIGATNGSGATFKESDLLWPIPINEIQRNPNLTQNDGYSLQ